MTRSSHNLSSLLAKITIVAVTVASCASLTCLAPPVAHAQSDSETIANRVEELSAKGATLFRDGKYKEAIAIFEEAYGLAAVGNLLYNIALSWEKLDDLEEAVKAYERFIIADDADPGVRKKALARIKTLNEEVERRKKIADKKKQDSNVAKNGDGKGGVGDGKGKGSEKSNTGDGGLGGAGIGGIVIAGVGLTAVGLGAVFGLSAADNTDKFEEARTVIDKDTFKDNAEGDALLADIFYGAGGAAIVVGVVLLILDSSNGETNTATADSPSGSAALHDITVTPWLGADAAGAGVGFTF